MTILHVRQSTAICVAGLKTTAKNKQTKELIHAEQKADRLAKSMQLFVYTAFSLFIQSWICFDQVHVRFNGTHIPGSPFKVVVGGAEGDPGR